MWLLLGLIWSIVAHNDAHPVTEEELAASLLDFSLLEAPPDNSLIFTQDSYFEGDILQDILDDGTQPQHDAVDFRSNPNAKWPNQEVPYKISDYPDPFSKGERARIVRAIAEFHTKTCIKFIPWRGNGEVDYVDIKKGNGCSSFVGRRQSQDGQLLSLGKGCVYVGVILHELMHAVGFWHEQSRSDRDDHVIIKWENIEQTPENRTHNFVKKSRSAVQDLGLPYDFASLMHYRNDAFAINTNLPTIFLKKSGVSVFGQRKGLSELDVIGLNLLYGCPVLYSPGGARGVDTHYLCSYWASKGECKKKQKYMHGYCKASCNKYGRCPKSEGYMKPVGSSQCFRFYPQTKHSWKEAKKWCTNERMALAKPEDDVVGKLSQDILQGYPSSFSPVWVGARGSSSIGARGSSSGFVWDRDDSEMSSIRWINNAPGSSVGNDYCLTMLPFEKTNPYSPDKCDLPRTTLCEVIDPQHLWPEVFN